MSQIDASDYATLTKAVEEHSNEELASAIQAQDGGVDGVLEQVLGGMVTAFNAAKAANQPSTSPAPSIGFDLDLDTRAPVSLDLPRASVLVGGSRILN